MKDHTEAQSGDNAATKFKEFDDAVAKIGKSLTKAQKHLASNETATFEAIGQALDLGWVFARLNEASADKDWSLLKDFLQYNGQSWSAKCESNFFHGIVTVAFDVIDPKTDDALCSAPQMSKFRAMLRYAHKEKLDGSALVELLEEKRLNGVYELAFQRARFDPFERFAEDEDQRFDRAVTVLSSKTNFPTGNFTTDLAKPQTKTGFVPAMIKVGGNGFEVVGVLDGFSDEDVKAKVANLVPAQAKRSSIMLSKQPGYSMFVVCDLFTRFLPDLDDPIKWAEAIEASKRPFIDTNSSDEDIAAYEDWWHENRTEPKPHGDDDDQETRDRKAKAMAKKFISFNALRFEPHSDGWKGESITTQPFNPYVEVRFPRNRKESKVDGPLAVRSNVAAQFVDQFPRQTPWRYGRHQAGLFLRSQSNKKHSFSATDLDHITAWRVLDANLETIGRFELTKPMLDALDQWKSNFAGMRLHGRNPFHSHQRLFVEEVGLELAILDHLDIRRPLGNWLSEPPTAPVEGHRFLEFKTVRKLIDFAIDYGVSYEIELLAGHQGLTALKFTAVGLPIEASMTLPLLLSQKGNPVEINFPR